MCERRPLWKRRERALLYLSHLKCARQLIVTNHIRESGGEQVTATRVYARARPGIYACGSGREVPSFGWFFVSCITRAHVHTHTRAPTSASVSEKKCARGRGRECACVYIAPLECVPGVWIRRPPEIGWCKKEKRKTLGPDFFLQVAVNSAYIGAIGNRETRGTALDGTLRDYRVLYDISIVVTVIDALDSTERSKNRWNFYHSEISIFNPNIAG